jgi:glycosyltransferase involved in cell wall biosynthesis
VARLLNALGPRFEHTLIALDGNVGALEAVEPSVHLALAPAPPGKGSPLYGLAWRSTVRQVAPDLLVTYGWGAIDAIIGQLGRRACSILHYESGFLADEARALKWRRVAARRLLLRTIFATVVVSETLLDIALRRYRLPRSKVAFIPNGVDAVRFTPSRDLAWRRARGVPDDALLIGTVCGLRPEKNLGLLLRAFAAARLQDGWLALVGDGPCRADLERLATSVGLARRVLFTGHTREPERAFAAFDVFALSSATEQMPNALLQAMACGLPAVCTDVGDCHKMLGGVGFPAIVARDDESGLAAALATLGRQPGLRAALGTANRARCLEHHPLARSLASHAALYEAALASRSELAAA